MSAWVQEADACGDLFSYGQVLAIYDDGYGEGIFIELRWFSKPKEISVMKKKK